MDRSGLTAQEKVVLSIDTSDKSQAEKLVVIAKGASARFVKFGLEISSATSWQYCSGLAAQNGLEWIADAKLDDIPNTVAGAVNNLKNLEYPPFGITIHTTAGQEAMKVAQEAAGEIIIFGVTVLTSIKNDEAEQLYNAPVKEKVLELALAAADSGLKGIVSSPLEINGIKQNPATSGLFSLIPGTRSHDAVHGDQARVSTPAKAIKNGADLLVIGRQITEAENPNLEFEKIISEIKGSI